MEKPYTYPTSSMQPCSCGQMMPKRPMYPMKGMPKMKYPMQMPMQPCCGYPMQQPMPGFGPMQEMPMQQQMPGFGPMQEMPEMDNMQMPMQQQMPGFGPMQEMPDMNNIQQPICPTCGHPMQQQMPGFGPMQEMPENMQPPLMPYGQCNMPGGCGYNPYGMYQQTPMGSSHMNYEEE